MLFSVSIVKNYLNSFGGVGVLVWHKWDTASIYCHCWQTKM